MPELDLGKFEVLLDDLRVDRILHRLKSQFGHETLKDTQLVTFIQPARPMQQQDDKTGLMVRGWLPEMAVFGVISPDPREWVKKRGGHLMTHATVALSDWRDDEKSSGHFAGVGDPAHPIFQKATREHLNVLQSAREQIT